MGLLDNIPWGKKNDNNGAVSSSSPAASDTGEVNGTQAAATSKLPETISNSQKTQAKTDGFQTNGTEPAELTELRDKKEKATTKLNDAVIAYEQIVRGTEPNLSLLKNDVDSKQEAYLKAVDESQNEEVIAIKDEIKQTENSLRETSENIAGTEVVIQERKITIADITNKISAKDSLIGSLASKIIEFQTQLNNTQDEDNKINIRAKINQFQAQKGYEEAQKVTLESSKKSLEEQLEAEEKKKSKLEREKQDLEKKKNELDAKVLATKDKTVKDALNAYNKALKDYQDEVKQYETKKTSAQKDIENAQNEIKLLDAQIAQKEAEILEKQLIAEAKKLAEAQKIANAKQAAGGNGGDVGGAHAITGNNAAIDNQASNEVKIKELRDNVKTAKEELDAKESVLYGIYDGTNEEIKKAKETRDNSFETFCKALAKSGNTPLADELRNDKKEVDRLEKDYYLKCKSVSEFESKIGASNGTFNLITQKITILTQTKENLEGSEATSDDTNKKQELLSGLNEELDRLNNEKQELEQTINDNETLNKLKEERDNAKALYEEADRKLSEKMEGAVSANSGSSELTSAKTAYDSAKKEYNTKFTSAVEKASGEITSAQSKVYSLSETLGVAEGNDLASKYKYFSGGAIVDIARKYIGLKEGDGSADIFWQRLGMSCSSRSMPWCAAFVSSILLEAGVDLTGAYKNSVSGLMSFAKSKGTFISGSQANANNIKPGFAVFWKGGPFASHTGIVSQVYPDNTFDTIEGNCSNQVKACNRRYKMSQAAGFMAT